MATDFTTLTLGEVESELHAIARETQAVFGSLDERQLNWRPDASRWSVAQCFDHLLSSNDEMFRAMDAALDSRNPRTVWQRLPVLPGVFGRLMIKSLTPQATRKFKSPASSRPSTSTIDASVIPRFIASQDHNTARVRAIAESRRGEVIMVSPFVSFITYSVLDACRLIAAHQWRHFEQARRVMRAAQQV